MLSRLIKDINGNTAFKIMQILNTNTHCGKYWSVKTKFNVFTMTLTQTMLSNERYVYSLRTGRGYRENYDGQKSISKFTIHNDAIQFST